MKVQRKKRSPLVRALGFGVAMILVLALMPFNALDLLTAYAGTNTTYTTVNYNYITIDGYGTDGSDTVTRGGDYTIRNAYIGDSNIKIGDTSKNATVLNSDSDSDGIPEATLTDSSVTVTYGGNAVTVLTGTEAGETYSYFTATKQGTYTVTYSYTFTISGEEYTNSYDISVDSVVSDVTVSIVNDGKNVLPSIIDLTLYKEAITADKASSKIYIPAVEVTDADGEEIEDVEIVANSINNATQGTGKVVVVTAYGGNNAEKLYDATQNYNFLTTDTDGIYIDSAVFDHEKFGVGDYVITFAYYENGDFVNSTTKTITVSKEYYTDYKLAFSLETDWTDNGETGVENTLPVATGLTADTTSPASEAVDVVYTVEVKFYATDSTTSYAKLDTSLYNVAGEDDVLYEEDGKTYLVDPTSFKPLEDGYYTFIYTITDFYGNTYTTDSGSYVYSNITDETAPTPILFDASEFDYSTTAYEEITSFTDASDKFATRAVANGVIVYAIGMEDNVSGVADEDVSLVRQVMTSSTEKFVIEGYDAYNLVFNYYASSGKDTSGYYLGWSDLLVNNYQLRKLEAEQIESGDLSSEISSDAEMLAFLKANNFLIVIDNSNYEVIYKYFTQKDGDDKLLTEVFKDFADANALLAWLQTADEEAIAALGFAYIDVDETFGASSSQGDIKAGMGTAYYYVHYIATDAAGNQTDESHRIYIVSSFTDATSPVLTFSTTLKKSYTSTSTITFTAPTVTDNIDNNLSVKTLYRYLDQGGAVVTTDVKDNDGNELTDDDFVDLTWVLKDIYSLTDSTDNGKFTRTEYETYATDYEKYLGKGTWNSMSNEYEFTSTANAGGYIELTDADASTYSIDLSNAPDTVSEVQILVYVYDDSGNVAILGKTVSVRNSNDSEPLRFMSYSFTDVTTSVYDQSETIELPTLVVKDDAISYVSYVVGVNFLTEDGTTKITPSGYSATNPNNSKYTMQITGGTFVASYEGTYTAYIAAKDDAGNMVVAFATYEAEGVDVIQTPVLSGLTMEKTQEYEVDDYSRGDKIEIDIPTVSYEIENSVTYDVYSANNYTADAKITTVIMNVNSDDSLDVYTNNTEGLSNELDVYKLYEKGGTATIIYTANVITYEIATFSYVEETYALDDTNYYTSTSLIEADRVYVSDDGNYVVYEEAAQKYYLLVEEYDEQSDSYVWNMYQCDKNGKNANTTTETLSNDMSADIETITDNIKIYHLVSDTYTITVTDTTAPTIANYNYDAIAKSDEDTVYLHVSGLEAIDAYLDKESCSITISCTLASGSKSSKTLTGSEAFEGYGLDDSVENSGYELARDSDGVLIDGTYKIVYTAVDLSGNTSTKTYTVAVGDNTAPTITIDDDFCEDSYVIGTVIKLDLTKIDFYDASGINEDSITYTLTDSSGNEIEPDSESDDLLVYYENIEDVDTYTFTIYVEDSVGWSTTKTVTFTVEAKSTDSTSVYQIVGIILIVVSVLVLVGVIVYFIVSKVKLDKELKK